jgi:hypothetical protein
MCDRKNPVKPSPSGKLLDADTWDALRKAGVPQAELEQDQPLGPVVFSYTRADAIRDGVLVDLMADGETKLMVHEAGFRLPIAMTTTAFHEAVLLGTTETPDGEFVFPASQSLKGRLWDVLFVLRFAIRAANRRGDTDRVHFQVSVYQGDDRPPKTVRLWCQIGPGDSGEPVLTLMCEGED